MKRNFGCVYDEVTQKIEFKDTIEEIDEEKRNLTR